MRCTCGAKWCEAMNWCSYMGQFDTNGSHRKMERGERVNTYWFDRHVSWGEATIRPTLRSLGLETPDRVNDWFRGLLSPTLVPVDPQCDEQGELE